MLKKENEILTVAYITDSAIAFEEYDEEYGFGDNQQTDKYETWGVVKGAKCEVGVVDGKIVFIKAQKSSSGSTGTKKKSSASTSSQSKGTTFTVKAVSTKFQNLSLEGEEKNYNCAKYCDGVIAEKGISIGDNVEIDVETGGSGGKYCKSITVVSKGESAPASKTTEKKSYKSSYSGKSNDGDARQNSIESQAAVNSACAVVAQVFMGCQSEVDARILIELINVISENNHSQVQTLKQKA